MRKPSSRPPLPAGEGRGEGRPLDIIRARDLRDASTRAERILWRRLRDRRLCGVKFRRQHPVGGFVVDFCAVDERLIVELDGGQHARFGNSKSDEARTRALEEWGFRVVRFWNPEVVGNLESVLRRIAWGLMDRSTPSP